MKPPILLISFAAGLCLFACGDDDAKEPPTEIQPDAGINRGGSSGDAAAQDANAPVNQIPLDAATNEPRQAPMDAEAHDSASRVPVITEGSSVNRSDASPGDSGARIVEAGADACAAACVAAARKGCQDNSKCEDELCLIRADKPNCVAEADRYLLCVAESPVEDFSCVENAPAFTGFDCDPVFVEWLDCP